jgi:hypothetical protein
MFRCSPFPLATSRQETEHAIVRRFNVRRSLINQTSISSERPTSFSPCPPFPPCDIPMFPVPSCDFTPRNRTRHRSALQRSAFVNQPDLDILRTANLLLSVSSLPSVSSVRCSDVPRSPLRLHAKKPNTPSKPPVMLCPQGYSRWLAAPATCTKPHAGFSPHSCPHLWLSRGVVRLGRGRSPGDRHSRSGTDFCSDPGKSSTIAQRIRRH